MLNQKVIFIDIIKPSQQTLQHIITTISNSWTNSFPTCTHTDPTTYLVSDISSTTFLPTAWPRYCQVTTCPMHNNKLPLVPDSIDGSWTIHLHVQHLHNDIFLSLTPQTLHSIGWSRCCPTCPTLFPNMSTHLLPHQEQCPLYNDSTTSTARPNPPPFDYSGVPAWSLAFAICPNDRTPDLNTLIDNFPDFADHDTTLSSILMTVSQWCLDAASSTATNHLQDD